MEKGVGKDELYRRLIDELEEERENIPDDVVEILDEIREKEDKAEKIDESLKDKISRLAIKTFVKEGVREILESILG